MASAGLSSPQTSFSPSSTFFPLVETLFQRSLDDMIKALRASPDGDLLIHRLLAEIRREIRSTDLPTKSLALQKLTYLSSLHSLDMSWAAFHAVELLPSPFYALKRAAYLCASLSFHPSSTDLLPLAIHQLRKDLQSPNSFVSSSALHLLAVSSSPDLILHLSHDVVSLLSSSQASSRVRRRAVAASFPVICVAPDSTGVFVPKLVESLSPSSPLLSSAVGVFCELVSCGDPRRYLHLAPDFHRILVESRNNWVLIKVLKIFARLILIEPRLSRKLVEPIHELMCRSPAKSLVFECVRIVFSTLFEQETVFRLAVETVKGFIAAENDPNLRFLGLHALTMLGPGQSWAVEENREAIVKFLADSDPNIRQEALRLIMNMVSETNLVEISAILINYSLRLDPEFSNEIFEAMLVTCGRNFYELVMDFDWYVSLLTEMARNPHFMKGEEVERQLIDIALRVKEARPVLVHVARDLLIDPALLGNQFLHRVLSSVAWISGEYIQFSRNPLEILEALLQPRTSLLPSFVRAVYIQAVFKVIAFCLNSFLNVDMIPDSKIDIDNITAAEGEDIIKVELLGMKDSFTRKSILHMLDLILTVLSPLSGCDEVEVQERARNVLGLVGMLNEIEWKNDDAQLRTENKIRDVVKTMDNIFSEELGPVSIHAQKRVLVPEGLELKENLSDLALFLGNSDILPSLSISFSVRTQNYTEYKGESEPASESTSLLAEHRKRHELYYLPATKDENESNEYPRANVRLKSDDSNNTTDDLIKLTDQSLVPRLTKSSKPRPTVVKLDGGDDVLSSSSSHAKVPKEDIFCSTDKGVPFASKETSATNDKPHYGHATQKMVKETSSSNVDSLSKEFTSSSSRKDNHYRQGKERLKNTMKYETKEVKGHRSSSRNSHHYGRHTNNQSRESGDPSSNIASQTEVIQDFLL